MSTRWEAIGAALDDLEDELRELRSRIRSAAPQDDPEQLQIDWTSLAERAQRMAETMGQLGRRDPADAAGMEAEARVNRLAAAIGALWDEMLRKWESDTLHADRRPITLKSAMVMPGAHRVYR